MECAEVLECVRIGIDAVIKANGTDRQLVPQARADRVAHGVQADILGRWQKIPGIGKYCSL